MEQTLSASTAMRPGSRRRRACLSEPSGMRQSRERNSRHQGRSEAQRQPAPHHSPDLTDVGSVLQTAHSPLGYSRRAGFLCLWATNENQRMRWYKQGDTRYKQHFCSLNRVPPCVKHADTDNYYHQRDKQPLHRLALHLSVQFSAQNTSPQPTCRHQHQYRPSEVGDRVG